MPAQLFPLWQLSLVLWFFLTWHLCGHITAVHTSTDVELLSLLVFSEIKATVVATGWPPTVIASWNALDVDAQYNLFYSKSNDLGCPSRTSHGLLLASWCTKTSIRFGPRKIFQCNITEAYVELDLLEQRSYYNLCVVVVANTSTGPYYSNTLQADPAATSNYTNSYTNAV